MGEAARAAVLDLLDRFAADPATQRAGRLRWAVSEGLHLTLRFLGATPEERVPDAAAAVEAAVRGVRAFRVGLSGAGAFPSADRPRVVWLGVSSGAPDLAALAARLEGELAARGWEPDPRPFRAHLTLARADGVPGAALAVEALSRLAADLDTGWTADRLILYQSLLGGGSARYRPLAEGSLGRVP